MYKVIRSSKNHVAGNYLNEVEHKQRWPGVATEQAAIKSKIVTIYCIQLACKNNY